MGKLTTHVLDTATGRPAAGVAVELRRGGTRAICSRTARTNARRPLRQAAARRRRRSPRASTSSPSTIADYFRAQRRGAARPAFPRHRRDPLRRSPTPRNTTTCRCSSRPGAIPPTAGAELSDAGRRSSASCSTAASSKRAARRPRRRCSQYLRETARAHRHQGRLRRGRLRRVHRGPRRAARRRARIDYRAVNSCIRFLPTIDGKAVVTVESLRAPGRHAAPGAAALVDCHASQCGFCTPGFVMSLFALYLERARSRARRGDRARSSGNLCRCTGYRPIIEAGCRMADYPEPAAWSRADAQSARAPRAPARRSARCGAASRYRARLPRAAHARRACPALRSARRDSLLLAGGTDIGLWVTKQLRDLPPLLYVGDVAELEARRAKAASALEIGAAVAPDRRLRRDRRALSDARGDRRALRLAADPQFRHAVRQHRQRLAHRRFDADTDRARAPTVLLRRGARESRAAARRVLPRLPEDRARAGRVRASRCACRCPARSASSRATRSPSASTRTSPRCARLRARRCATGRSPRRASPTAAWRRSRSARGTPKRRSSGKPWSEETVRAAAQALARDFQPITDMRASAGYRLQVARNLLRRFYLEHCDAGSRCASACSPG